MQPIDQVIGGWKGFVEARRAWQRLRLSLDGNALARAVTDLPEPVGRLDIEQVVVFPPHAPGAEPLLKRVSAAIQAGECVAVIGPSGAGKSTLIRTVIGAIEPRTGAVRIDGADLRNWDGEKLGRHFGYLAQDVELLPGTIAQNIARFTPDAPASAVLEASHKAQVHDLIQKLPKGYDTQIGPGGLQLSGGQRQRVGLARAFFGSPRILVLDEPNANLDGEGDQALERALDNAKQDRVTVVIVTQRRQIAEKADKILILRDGAVEDYGPRMDVYARQAQKARAAQESPAAGAAPQVVAGRFPAVIGGGAQAKPNSS
ncbi:MAG: ATP-binding cassette domain-containing protein [Pseudaminobacter sp.]|nr:ATP-binding cassette domain-containing protein [Pseudaminobacter sp.]